MSILRKLFPLFVILVALSSSCKEESKLTQGTICRIDDKILVIQAEDGTEQTFNIENAEYSNGVVMNGDKVVIAYTGNPLKTAKASIITLRIQPRYIEDKVDETKPLITR